MIGHKSAMWRRMHHEPRQKVRTSDTRELAGLARYICKAEEVGS